MIFEYRNQKGKADLLVLLDKKHLLEKPELAAFAGVQIVTPLEAFANLRKRNIPKKGAIWLLTKRRKIFLATI